MNEEKRAAAQPATDGSVEKLSLPRNIHMVPLNYISGFAVRPGLYDIYGATAIPGGVNFTVYSYGATSIELLLFHREAHEPFAVLPFPQHYRIGNVYSMIVFKLNIEDQVPAGPLCPGGDGPEPVGRHHPPGPALQGQGSEGRL